MGVNRKRDEYAISPRSLVEQLMATDWEKTPIRNFIDARPDPYRVAGTLIKMGLMHPSDAADYDWQEIDYAAFPTVRRLLEHYARIVPTSRLTVLLSKAGRRVLQQATSSKTEDYELAEPHIGAEEMYHDVTMILEKPWEYGIADAPKALAELAVDTKTLDEFGLDVKTSIVHAIMTAENLWGACSSEYADFMKNLQDIIDSNPKRFKGIYLSKLEHEAYKLLGISKKKAIDDCKRLRKDIEAITENKEGVSIMSEKCNTLIEDAEHLKKDKTFKQIVPLAEMDIHHLHPNWKDKIPDGYVLKSGPVFIVTLAKNFPQWKEEACYDPARAERMLHKLSRIVNVIRDGLDIIRGQMTIMSPDDVYKAITKALFEYFITAETGYSLDTDDIIHDLGEPPGIQKVDAIEQIKKGAKVLRAPPTRTASGKEVLARIDEFIDELEFFLPGTAAKVRAELKNTLSAEASKYYIVPTDPNVVIPTLSNSKLRLTADVIYAAYKNHQLPADTVKALTTEGVPLENGEIVIHNGKLLHRVTQYNGYNLADMGYFVYYDPTTGSYYMEQRGRLVRTPLPKIIATISKDFQKIPSYGTSYGTAPTEHVYYKGIDLGTPGMPTPGQAPPAMPYGQPALPPELKNDLDEINMVFGSSPKITNPALKKVLSVINMLYGPAARRDMEKLIAANGDSVVEDAIQNVMERGYKIEDPEFISKVRDTIQFYHQFGRFPSTRGTEHW